ncbi:hypothetical protein THAOC_23235 [Thalassiosira oceanica]|uniref:Uncharacterized protein n=1 Tax=Thalassiosira oceanica TaxID=159749 RepID=K0RSM5_THAOC|nr:hypothetical protein THAOC_23235 [Thalassiosira oceanica]|eukprot:EJK56803.1 hypothetical protein THAOC_23235 [Thalassiosira oceanica]
MFCDRRRAGRRGREVEPQHATRQRVVHRRREDEASAAAIDDGIGGRRLALVATIERRLSRDLNVNLSVAGSPGLGTLYDSGSQFQHTLAESSVAKLVVKSEAICLCGHKRVERVDGYLPNDVWKDNLSEVFLPGMVLEAEKVLCGLVK